MPRHQEAKKDVTSCEKTRGGANIRKHSCISEWGNLLAREVLVSIHEYIVYGSETRGTETSKYPEEKKENNRFCK